MDRTVVLDINPTPEQATTLLATIGEYTACFNAVAREGYTSACFNGVELHKRTYYPLRTEHPTLPAQLVVSSRMKATEAVKSALTHKRRGRKTSVPHAQFCPIRYDMRSYWVKWETAVCSLASVSGRLQLPFNVPAYARKYIGGKVASADLIYKRGRWRLHVVVSLPAPDIAPTDDVVGVDLGVVRPAVTSNNRFLGQRRWREQEARIFRLRRKLQAKGTRSAKRHLRKLSGKLFRQRRDHDHVLSKRIVQATSAGGTIVLENLTDIRKRVKQRGGQQSRRLHSWSFAQLQAFTRYKAQDRGQRVVLIDPRKTSQTCNRCGYASRANRPKQAVFCCRDCGYQLNCDLSAARNIAAKYLAQIGTSELSGPPSNGLSSRTLVVQGQATPL
jgi:putative transposase